VCSRSRGTSRSHLAPLTASGRDHGPSGAPAAFDGKTNGFTTQAQFDADRAIFEEAEEADEGLGPIFNHNSCRACHLNPVTGGPSQIFEVRAGHFDGSKFIPHPGGDLIQDNAIDPRIQERVLDGNEVRTFRVSTNTLGAGFVEAISNDTLLAIRAAQPPAYLLRNAGKAALERKTVAALERDPRLAPLVPRLHGDVVRAGGSQQSLLYWTGAHYHALSLGDADP
jgi:hypothetical protein